MDAQTPLQVCPKDCKEHESHFVVIVCPADCAEHSDHIVTQERKP